MFSSTYFLSAQSRTQIGAQTPFPPRSTLPSGRRGVGCTTALSVAGAGLADTDWAPAIPDANGRAASMAAARITDCMVDFMFGLLYSVLQLNRSLICQDMAQRVSIMLHAVHSTCNAR